MFSFSVPFPNYEEMKEYLFAFSVSSLETLCSWWSAIVRTFFHECFLAYESQFLIQKIWAQYLIIVISPLYQSLSKGWSLNNFQVSCNSQYPPPMGEASTMVHTGPFSPSQQIALSSSSIKVSFYQEKAEVTSLKRMWYCLGFYWCPVSRTCIFSCSQECCWFFCWSGFIYDPWPMSIKGITGVWGLKLWMRN